MRPRKRFCFAERTRSDRAAFALDLQHFAPTKATRLAEAEVNCMRRGSICCSARRLRRRGSAA